MLPCRAAPHSSADARSLVPARVLALVGSSEATTAQRKRSRARLWCQVRDMSRRGVSEAVCRLRNDPPRSADARSAPAAFTYHPAPRLRAGGLSRADQVLLCFSTRLT